MRYLIVLLFILTGCGYVVVVDHQTSASGGAGGGETTTPSSTLTWCGEPATPQLIANQLAVPCEKVQEGPCEAPLTREQAVNLILGFVTNEGWNDGYYEPTKQSFSDTQSSTIENAVFLKLLLPEPYDGTAEFHPDDPADTCFTAEIADRALHMPEFYVIPTETYQDFEIGEFSQEFTPIMSYQVFGKDTVYYVRLMNDHETEFIDGIDTASVDKIHVTCKSGEFVSERITQWPLSGGEVIDEAPADCFDHGDGLFLHFEVSSAFYGKATIGLAASTPTRRWKSWQDSMKPPTMTVIQ